MVGTLASVDMQRCSVKPNFIRKRAVRARGGGRAGGRGADGKAGRERSWSRVCPSIPKRAFGCGGRKHDERARWAAVVPLALEKRLFLNVSCRCLLVPLPGKKSCNINKWLDPF